MYDFHKVTKGRWASIVATALLPFIGMPLASAATYTYNLSDVAGYITTNCDNCVLSSSNIVAWSMSVPGFSIASTDPGAGVYVPAGDTDMGATPGALNFAFTGTFFGIRFTGSTGTVGYDDAGPYGNIGFGPGFGVISECDNSDNCNFVGGTEGTRSIGTPVVPFSGTVTYNFTGTVTSANGIYSSTAVGTPVTGTFTIDLDAGDGALPVSLTAPWTSFSTNSTPRVVASTLKSGGVKFSDAGSTSNKTSVAGLAPAGSSTPNEYVAYDTEFSDSTNSLENSFQLIGGTGASAPFGANGMPIFQNATGGASGTLSAYVGSTNSGQLNYTITSFTPAPPTVTLSPLSLNFPDQLANFASAPMTVTLTNTGPSDVSISSVSVTGIQANDFQVAGGSCGSLLPVNTSCTITVVFAPFSAGPKKATLTVIDNASGSQRAVALSGTATVNPAPTVSLNTLAVSFASQQVGTASAARTITVKNIGTAALSIYSITIVGSQADDFTLTNHCGASLAVGQMCALFVSFKPLAAGAKSAAVLINDNASGEQLNNTPGSQRSIALSGTATAVSAPQLSLSATSLSFPSEPVGTASAARAVNLTNIGTAPLSMTSISIVGSQADDFILQKACGASLPVGKSCALFVTFKPVAAGAKSAGVLIVDNAQGSQRSVALTGTGL